MTPLKKIYREISTKSDPFPILGNCGDLGKFQKIKKVPFSGESIYYEKKTGNFGDRIFLF